MHKAGDTVWIKDYHSGLSRSFTLGTLVETYDYNGPMEIWTARRDDGESCRVAIDGNKQRVEEADND